MHKATAGSIVVLFTLVVSALPVVGCGQEEEVEAFTADADSSEQAIVGGRLDTGDPAVVALYAQTSSGGGALCTGTVISPTAIITAAHCVEPTENPGAQFFVLPVNDIDAIADESQVLAVDRVTFDPQFDINHPEDGHDIAIVVLAQPTTITPIPVNLAGLPRSIVGKNIRIVGYGLSNARRQTGAGVKRHVTVPLTDFDESLLKSGTSTKDACSGDSGGPLFYRSGGKDIIVGLTSFGSQFCNGGGFATRVDAYDAFLAPFLTPGYESAPLTTNASNGAPNEAG